MKKRNDIERHRNRMVTESDNKYSNKDYKKLGDRIRSNPHDIAKADLLMLQSLRMSYKEPLSIIFKSIEKTAHKVDEDCM